MSGYPRVHPLHFADHVTPRWLSDRPALPVRGLQERIDSPGDVLVSALKGASSYPIITRNGTGIEWTCDSYHTMRAIFEEGFVSSRPFSSRLPVDVRRLVPRRLRRVIKQVQLSQKGGDRDVAFPRWPVESSLMALHHVLVSQGALQPITWPASKKFAVCLTHDVDSGEGFVNIPILRDLARKHGIPLTWYLLARVYRLDRSLIQELIAAGDEIASHGYTHDNRLAFLSEIRMTERFRYIADTFAGLTGGRVGFRSPSLYMTPALRKVVREYCAYDSSCVDTGILSPEPRNRGCGYLFPFRLDGLVHVPITVPLESSLIFRGMSAGEMVAVWEKKIGFIRQTGGAAVICTHPEPHLLMQKEFIDAYRAFVARLADDGDAYFCTVKDLAALYLEQCKSKPVDILPETHDSESVQPNGRMP